LSCHKQLMCPVIDISKDKNRMLKVCYVPATSAGRPGFFF